MFANFSSKSKVNVIWITHKRTHKKLILNFEIWLLFDTSNRNVNFWHFYRNRNVEVYAQYEPQGDLISVRLPAPLRTLQRFYDKYFTFLPRVVFT